jgi:hypothetical protein
MFLPALLVNERDCDDDAIAIQVQVPILRSVMVMMMTACALNDLPDETCL